MIKPKFFRFIKVKPAIVYLWRMLRYALPLLAAGILIGLAPQLARVMI